LVDGVGVLFALLNELVQFLLDINLLGGESLDVVGGSLFDDNRVSLLLPSVFLQGGELDS
jgi:hypothetical protein